MTQAFGRQAASLTTRPIRRTRGESLDWVIVGGGIHGVHVAIRLLGEGVERSRLRIVDPHRRLLGGWRARTSAAGMAFLRSPVMQHIDTAPYSLQQFANERFPGAASIFAPPNDRPSLELFNTHCEDAIQRHGLAEAHIRGRVEAMRIEPQAVSLHLADGNEFRARQMVLALGSSEAVEWPTWAPQDHPRIRHIFDPRPVTSADPNERVGVLGGGVSAAQVALRLAGDGHRVDLITRHALRTRQYDSDPGWHGPKYMRSFHQVQDPAVRRKIVDDGRHRGSMPPDVRESLERSLRRGGIRQHTSDVKGVDPYDDQLRMRLANGQKLDLSDLYLATGFSRRRPGGAWIDELVQAASLPCAPCGYPIVDPFLRWHPRIQVTGPLAELEIGPVARNIAGARRAGERIVASLQASASAARMRCP